MRVHSLLSPQCCIRESKVGGRGVFALESFAKDELVAVWGGKVYTADEVAMLAQVVPSFATHTISLCEGYYLGSENLFEFDDAELINHSCDANVGIRGQVILVARRPIKSGDELTYDYDTSEISAVPFQCCCGTVYCRGVIDGSAWKEPVFQEQYRGYLSWYIEFMLRRGKERKGKERKGKERTGQAGAPAFIRVSGFGGHAMLLVRARVGVSDIHGLGLIAVEYIPIGTVVWEFCCGFDLELTESQVARLPLTVREQVLNYCDGDYDPSRGIYTLSMDDARFTNHSDTPNTASAEDGRITVATRDIQPGDEITWDYRSWLTGDAADATIVWENTQERGVSRTSANVGGRR